MNYTTRIYYFDVIHPASVMEKECKASNRVIVITQYLDILLIQHLGDPTCK